MKSINNHRIRRRSFATGTAARITSIPVTGRAAEKVVGWLPDDPHFNVSNGCDCFSGICVGWKKRMAWQDMQDHFHGRNHGVNGPDATDVRVPVPLSSQRGFRTLATLWEPDPEALCGGDYSVGSAIQFGGTSQAVQTDRLDQQSPMIRPARSTRGRRTASATVISSPETTSMTPPVPLPLRRGCRLVPYPAHAQVLTMIPRRGWNF